MVDDIGFDTLQILIDYKIRVNIDRGTSLF